MDGWSIHPGIECEIWGGVVVVVLTQSQHQSKDSSSSSSFLVELFWCTFMQYGASSILISNANATFSQQRPLLADKLVLHRCIATKWEKLYIGWEWGCMEPFFVSWI